MLKLSTTYEIVPPLDVEEGNNDKYVQRYNILSTKGKTSPGKYADLPHFMVIGGKNDASS